jgi:hypothetical protein
LAAIWRSVALRLNITLFSYWGACTFVLMLDPSVRRCRGCEDGGLAGELYSTVGYAVVKKFAGGVNARKMSVEWS